ncbi:MAG: metallophosphoesterase, partial [Pirellulaceae bacterium]|nr:metallophosphoesterase [Pirellulaceae bacterium]
KGQPDERGIPHATMADGTPNGYSILTFDGADYQLDYKAASRDRDYQMQIHAPDAVSSADATKKTVLANVFNGSERSVVEMRVGGGDWIAMNKTVVADPAYRALADASGNMPRPRPSSHIWAAKLPSGLPPGVHLIEVRTTDMHGRSCTGCRVVRVQPDEAFQP